MSDETNTKIPDSPNLDNLEQQQEMTPEQLAEYKKMRMSADKELKEEIKFLKTEHEYQKLICEVEEFKARRLNAYAQQSRFMQPPQENKPDSENISKEDGAKKKERTLTPD